MPDHIHLLVDCKPQFYISDMIKIMKGNLARQLFLSYPELKRELWGGHLWNPSYCAVTVSDRSKEQVLTYIKGQKEKEAALHIYRQAVGYLIRVYEESWEELSRIVTRNFQRCHLIFADQRFSMRLEACLHMRRDWNCGNKRNWTVSQSLYMKIMQCRYDGVKEIVKSGFAQFLNSTQTAISVVQLPLCVWYH